MQEPVSARAKQEPVSTKTRDIASTKKAFIEWSDALSIGVREIDDQHKHLAYMVNELNEGISGGWGKEAREHVLTELIEYTRVHFATEESLMSISAYPGAAKHKKQHESLIDTVNDHVKKYSDDPKASSYDLLFFLKKWLVNHIMGEDKNLGEYLIKKGFGNQEAKKSPFGWIKKLFGSHD